MKLCSSHNHYNTAPLNIDNILIEEKPYENILIYDNLQNLIGVKPCML